ncbi:gastrin/cholecystokinin type B receptor-like [Lampris incognitus]|uniref:gastrin/cholecystokinin type B receptor-like n=1 Tax=Lampris incognitus TaxID=2546036 RepID=UPI0024B5AC78|nr:gastrin/cholecystokinin type B receptor-like [Lampris incognitus]
MTRFPGPHDLSGKDDGAQCDKDDPRANVLDCLSLSNLESMLLWTLHEPGTIALTVMYCLSFMLGFTGNLMSLRVLTNRRNRRLASVSATRSLLVNLAVCDLAVVCVCMPITLGSQIYSSWVYGDLLCRAVPFTQAVSVSASVLTLTVISVNRYYSVRSPLRARSMFTRRRILATVAMVWMLSSVMCTPLAVMNRRREISFGTFAIWVCQEEWPQPRLKQGYNVLLFVVLYCLPVTFNLTIGFLTGRRLWGGRKSAFSDLDPRSQALHVSRLKTRQKIAKMVVCLVLLFAISWLPLYLADLWIDREQQPPPWLLQTRPFAQWLGLTNSSLNPICYCFIGDLYRSAKVIRTRYYRRVAALFGSSSFSHSAAIPTTTLMLTDAKVTDEHHCIAAATMAASASMVTVPRLFSLARGKGLELGQVEGDSLGCEGRCFIGINPERGTKASQGKVVFKKKGKLVQKKAATVNSHVDHPYKNTSWTLSGALCSQHISTQDLTFTKE